MTWHHKKHDTSDHSFTSHNAPLPTTCNGYSLYRLFAIKTWWTIARLPRTNP